MTSIRLILLMCLTCTTGGVLAQAPPSMTGQFLVFPKTADNSPLILLTGEGETAEIESTSGRFSLPVKVEKMGEWIVGKPGVDEEGKPKFDIWGRCKSSGGKKQSVVLFRKGAENSDGFNMMSFDSANGDLGNGQFMVFNVSNKDIGGQVGKQKFTLKPGGKTIIKPIGDLKKNLAFAMFAVKAEGKWNTIATSNWPLYDNARTFVFVYGDPSSKKYLVQTVRDFVN